MIPEYIKRWHPIVDRSILNGIPATTILAIIWQEVEADGSEWSHRMEEGYQYFYDYKNSKPLYDNRNSIMQNRLLARNILGTTEFYDQSSSWGLMEVMGAVAREYGLRGWIPRLCDPMTNILYGSLHLSKKLAQTGGDLREALKLYNGSYTYADSVLAKITETQLVV